MLVTEGSRVAETPAPPPGVRWEGWTQKWTPVTPCGGCLVPRTVGNLPSCRPQHSALAGNAPSTPLWLEKGQVTASCLVRLPEGF